MKISTPSDHLIFDQTTRDNPLFILQPIPEHFEGNPDQPVLLGPELDTTLIALGDVVPLKHWARRLHFKNDGEGLELEGVDVNDPFDVVGYVGGNKDFAEAVYALSKGFSFSIRTAYEGVLKLDSAFSLSITHAQRPTLVIYRDTLASTIAPELLEAKADPKFLDERQELCMLSDTFGQLVSRVLKEVDASSYLLID